MPNPLVDQRKAEPLIGSPNDFYSLLDFVGGARFISFGEANRCGGQHDAIMPALKACAACFQSAHV
jgi:hypothetical protein